MALYNVYWTVKKDASVALDTAHAVLEMHGIDTGLIPEISDHLAVRRGVKKLHNRRTADNRRVTEKIRENSDVAVFGVLNLVKDKSRDVAGYKQGTRVTLDKENGAVTVTGSAANEVLQEIQNSRDNVCDEDIRRLCFGYLRAMGAVSKRPSGGIYIVGGEDAEAKITRLQNAVTEMVGEDARIFTERIYDGEQERQNAAISFYDDVSVRIQRTIDAINNIGKQAGRINTHRVAVTQLKELTETYKGILGEQDALKDIEAMLQTAEAVIADKIVEVGKKIERAKAKKARKTRKVKTAKRKAGESK